MQMSCVWWVFVVVDRPWGGSRPRAAPCNLHGPGVLKLPVMATGWPLDGPSMALRRPLDGPGVTRADLSDCIESSKRPRNPLRLVSSPSQTNYTDSIPGRRSRSGHRPSYAETEERTSDPCTLGHDSRSSCHARGTPDAGGRSPIGRSFLGHGIASPDRFAPRSAGDPAQ